MSFIEQCLIGNAFLDEIDDYIDAWHESDASEQRELHEYLGLEPNEYKLWLLDPDILAFVVSARRDQTTLAHKLRQDKQALAARAETHDEAQKMVQWLKFLGEL